MNLLKRIGILLILIFAVIGVLFTGVFIAMQFGLLNVRGSIDTRNNSIFQGSTTTDSSAGVINAANDHSCSSGASVCTWDQTREWSVVAGGLTKDADLILQVAKQTDVSPRLIAAVIVPEQIRFFTSSREVFKRYFEPLKILGSLSKFSLGVSGIKQETARAIEQYAADPNSPFYPGDNYADLLAYPKDAHTDQALFDRLTNEKDHYYSYLYTAIYIKEIESQWNRAGYDITNKPAIVATLFNIGFARSTPHANPQVGGAPITVGGKTYTFGSLAGAFYNSTQLPRLKN